jgi:hypothetical protein
MKLYHVQADDPMAESLDWFIAANDPDEALKLWEAEMENNGFDGEAGITRMRLILDDVTGTRFAGPARAIDWPELEIVMEPE